VRSEEVSREKRITLLPQLPQPPQLPLPQSWYKRVTEQMLVAPTYG